MAIIEKKILLNKKSGEDQLLLYPRTTVDQVIGLNDILNVTGQNICRLTIPTNNDSVGWYKMGCIKYNNEEDLIAQATLLITPTYDSELTTSDLALVIGLSGRVIESSLVELKAGVILNRFDGGNALFGANDIALEYDSVNTMINVYIRNTTRYKRFIITVINQATTVDGYPGSRWQWYGKDTSIIMTPMDDLSINTTISFGEDITQSRYDKNGNDISTTYMTKQDFKKYTESIELSLAELVDVENADESLSKLVEVDE